LQSRGRIFNQAGNKLIPSKARSLWDNHIEARSLLVPITNSVISENYLEEFCLSMVWLIFSPRIYLQFQWISGDLVVLSFLMKTSLFLDQEIRIFTDRQQFSTQEKIHG
jgi:hypothetical protein